METAAAPVVGPAPGTAARELHERGLELFSRGRLGQAMVAFGRALRVLERSSGGTLGPEAVPEALVGRIWLSIALCEAERAGIDASLTALDRAAAAAARSGRADLGVLVHAQRGSILARLGRLDESSAALDAALAQADLLEVRDRVVLLLNRGSVSLYRGELRIAQDLLGQAVELADSGELAVQKLQAAHNLAYTRFLAGDLPSALHGMDAALAIVPDLASGVPLLDRARVLVEAGLTREADATLAEAEAIFRRDRLGQDVAEVQLERAHGALVAGDAAAARRFAARARDRFRRRGADQWRRSAELMLLQADLAGGRPGRRLVGPARRLRAEFVQDGSSLGAQTAGLVETEALLVAGDPAAAAQVLAEVAAASPADPVSARLHAHYVHARVAAAQGRTAAATGSIRRGLRDLATYQASFGSVDLRTAAAVHGRRLGRLDLALALDGGRPAAVFAAAERARAVSARYIPVRPPADPESADLLAELRRTVESLRGAGQDRAAARPLLARRRELERRIVARTWTAPGAGGAVDAVGVGEVQAALAAAGATMITYIQSGGSLWAVTVGARVRRHALGAADPVIEHVRRVRADLDVLAQSRLPQPLRGAVRASLATSLAALDDALVRPLRLAAEPVVIVSTGALGQLPWGSLASLRRVPLVVAPSATKWLGSSRPSALSGEPVVSSFAGPGLERAETEAKTVPHAWPAATVRVGPDATRARFLAAMSASDIVHIAAHGAHEPENPLFSSVRMADGPVFAHELDQHARAPQHVVLSACEVGLATVRPGDEALGLASVLLGLGTRCVLAGVARISDVVAEQTMASYHARLAAGVTSAAALADALAGVDTDVTPPLVAFGAAWSASKAGVRSVG